MQKVDPVPSWGGADAIEVLRKIQRDFKLPVFIAKR